MFDRNYDYLIRKLTNLANIPGVANFSTILGFLLRIVKTYYERTQKTTKRETRKSARERVQER